MSQKGREERFMKIATTVLAGAAAVAILSSAALAQEARKGIITGINRLNGTIAIQQTPSGTVGANAKGAPEQFKLQSGLSLDDWHAGDMVTFTTNETGPARTITKLQKQ
jgi:hypothetical protein